MTSTCNKNMVGDYQMETWQNNRLMETATFLPYAEHSETYLAGDGVAFSAIPASKMSKNSVDIESNLWGIRSTDLTLTPNNKPSPFKPEMTQLKSLHFVRKPDVIVPTPIKVELTQRPFIM